MCSCFDLLSWRHWISIQPDESKASPKTAEENLQLQALWCTYWHASCSMLVWASILNGNYFLKDYRKITQQHRRVIMVCLEAHEVVQFETFFFFLWDIFQASGCIYFISVVGKDGSAHLLIFSTLFFWLENN